MGPFFLALVVVVMLSSCIAIPVEPVYPAYARPRVVVRPPIVGPAPYYCCYPYPYAPYAYGYRYGYRR